MQRIVVLGPGASGKSTFASALSAATAIPVVELDELFWSPTLQPTPPERWAAVQEGLASGPSWILDGDLGPYDQVEVRLRRADAVVLFDVPRRRCVWRSLLRGRQRADYWAWVLTWRRRSRPELMRHLAEYPSVEVLVVRKRSDVERVTADIVRRAGTT